MDGLIRITILTGLLCLVSCDDSQITVSLDITESQVHNGANITLSCRVQNAGPGEIIYWSKGEEVRGGEGHATQLIATNDLLTPMYKETGRYHPSVVVLGDVYLYIMHIYGVTEHESGNFVCSIPRLDFKHDYKTLFVYEEAKSIEFRNLTERADGKVVLTEGEPHDLHCHMTQVNPMPRVAMSMGSRDLTRDVNTTGHKNLHCTNSVDNCPLNMDFDVHAVVEKHNATWRDDDTKLVCNSTIQGSLFPPMVASKDVKVLYKPKFLCSNVTNATLMASNLVISCITRLNPLPFELHGGDAIDPYWSFTVDGVESKLPMGIQTNEYNTMAKNINDTAYNYTLIIDMVRPYHFNVTYSLHVQNSIGHNTTGIKLMRDLTQNPDRPVGGATGLWFSLTALGVATLLSLTTTTTH